MTRWGKACALVFAVWGLSARAEDRHLMNLERQLSLSTSPAIRAKAAQLLAKLDDDEAVAPLCSSLATDADPSVRVESAKGLGSLGGTDAEACLKKNGAQSAPAVRAAVAEALGKVKANADREVRRVVLLQPLDAKHNTLGADAGELALRQLRRVLPRHDAWVPPANETPSQLRAELKRRKVPAYAVTIALTPSEGGGVSLDLLCTRYPKGSLIGNVTVKAKGGDVPDLIRALIPRALDEADVSCEWRTE